MAINSGGRVEPPLMTMRHWRDRETSPERTKVWTEPKPRKVAVVYYLSRNGHLEHPHFMEVPLAASEGLHLRDVLDRLNSLRGRGMADSYSWSSKRSYKNGFVWQDLSNDDLIHPTHGHEYVLKGSELLQPTLSSSSSQDTVSSSPSAYEKPPEMLRSSVDHYGNEVDRIQSKSARWSSFDVNEYKVYKMELMGESGAAVKMAVNVSTQTDDRRSRRRTFPLRDHHDNRAVVEEVIPTTELDAEEISPPPSSSSSETLESHAKAEDIKVTAGTVADDQDRRVVGDHSSGRTRASAVLMHFITCGSINVKSHSHQWHSLPASTEHHGRLLSRVRSDLGRKAADGFPSGNSGFPAVRLEDKEFFSGSLIETKNKNGGHGHGEVGHLLGLKRSSSYNADRSSKLDMAEKEADAARAKCVPIKHKAAVTRK